ncbi:MAG TPA: hypothetical protein VGQ00_01340 [Candidatus Norongarragalinales archaeon]|nr:hypothetical protein [Candidatus Norongarragalinales archaeon]
MSERTKHVAFADKQLERAYYSLKRGRSEERQLVSFIDDAINDLLENPLAGVIVPKSLWPQEYVRKHAIDNLRKYNLPNGWRLTYTIFGNNIKITSILLEWMSHKDYEKRFGYRTR